MSQVVDERIGMELAEGRYKILAQIGEGSMGRVYLARDNNLETEVVVKFPISGDASPEHPDLAARFARETRTLVMLSHPHVVKIIDVGMQDDRPYVVLQYLSGGTLKDRVEYGPDGPRPMRPQSLRVWLMDVARALDFIHAQGHIHRDVKPANILFDAHGHAFLGDFGIVKTLRSTPVDATHLSSETAPGFLMGTPSYVAPELVMGETGDGRSDQYSLAMMVHELLSGRNVMAGASPSATLVNQTKNKPTPLSSMVSGISRRLSDAVQKGLEKDPGGRYPTCTAMAEAILAQVPAGSWTPPDSGKPVLPCPLCRKEVEVGLDRVSQLLRCPRCRNPYRLEASEDGATFRLTPTEGSFSDAHWSTEFEVYQTGMSQALSNSGTSFVGSSPAASRMTRRVAAGLFLTGLAGAGGYWFLGRERNGGRPGDAGRPRAENDIVVPPPIAPVELNIAYGTEKRLWLEAALERYEQTPEGKLSKINLIGLGSVAGANAVIDGPGKTPIHVWSPASSAYRDAFERDWRQKHDRSPILKAEDLALTPMVFVLWKSRYQPFIAKYGKIDFQTLGQAMRELDGWGAIAGKPEWGHVKFGHTDPATSNSGLLALVLMAYDFAHKRRGLSKSDVTSHGFLEWLANFEREVTRQSGSLTASTGTLMEQMVTRGPSQYDGIFVYENLTIDFLEQARNRWGDEGELAVVYPEPNIWNEHPYYVLDVPWSTPAHREAAESFLEFLTSEPIQRRALDHGFRPGNPAVGVNFPESPIVKRAAQGLKVAVPAVCEPPTAEVVSSLLDAFSRLNP